MTSLLPTPEPPDPVEGALGHFEHSNWVKQALKNLDEGTVHSNGGVATGTLLADQVTIDNPEDQTAQLNLKGNSTKSVLSKTSGDLSRWQLLLGDNTVEGGGNAGSLFKLLAYTDAGAASHVVLKADRSSGLVEVKGDPTAALGVATKQYVDKDSPIGMIIAYGGSTIPAALQPYWHLCNGTAHGSAALQAVIGSANTPDLRSRFIVAAGQGPGLSNYAHGASGGQETVQLSEAQSGLVGHNHGGSIAGVGNHNHNAAASDPFQPGGAPPDTISSWGADTAYKITSDASSPWGRTSSDGGHTHGLTLNAVAGAGASQAHENRPPYYALTYIIKKA